MQRDHRHTGHASLRLGALALLVGWAGIAHAQPATPASSVTIYGVVDGCVARSDPGSAEQNLVNSGCQAGNRLGFRGNEELGGGYRAGFTLESGMALDSGQLAQGGRIFGRKALVSLGSPFGTIEIGRDYAPAFYIVQPVDPMGLGIGTASSSIWTGSSAAAFGRNDNVVNYLSPVWGGFSVRLQGKAGENNPATPKGYGGNVLYRSGATIAGVSHTRLENAAGTSSDRASTAVVRHDFGAFSLAAMIQSGAWEGSRTTAAPSSNSSIFSRDYRSYLIGGSVKVGPVGLVAFSFKRYDDRATGNFDFNQTSIIYLHSLSKRTDLYAAFSKLDNQRASSYAISDASVAYGGVTNGASPTLTAIGIRHLF